MNIFLNISCDQGKKPGCLGDWLGMKILPSYVGIIDTKP